MSSQSVRLNQYLAMCVGGGGGGLEGVSFYKRVLSRPVYVQFHSDLEITSANNTLPKVYRTLFDHYVCEA